MRNSLFCTLLSCALTVAFAGCSAKKDAGSAGGPSARAGSAASPDGESTTTAVTGDADSATEDDEAVSDSPDSDRRRVKKAGDEAVQQQLERSVELAEKNNAPASSIQAMLSLARFYRLHRRIKDYIATLEKAVAASKQLGGSDSDKELKGTTYAQLGDAYLRTGRIHESLAQYEQAMALLPKGSDDGECKLRMYPRIAWALRRSGDARQAAVAVQKAADEAKSSLGETAPLYRVALVEMAVMAIDRQDQRELDKLEKQLNELPTRHTGPFAKMFLRSCARQCRHAQQPEQAMFVDKHARYFMARQDDAL